MHLKIKKNKLGRDFIMGDLHGRYDLLKKAMKYNGFDKSKDRLFSVGDIIDRGKQSLKCLELLEQPWFFMVRGNHEQMMIDAITGVDNYRWQKSYGRWVKKLEEDELLMWARRLDRLPHSITVKSKGFSVGICHAEPADHTWPPNYNRKKTKELVLWGRRVLRNTPKKPVGNIDFTVHGHTPLEQPTWVGNRYFMDTGAWYSGTLTFRQLSDIHQEATARESLFG